MDRPKLFMIHFAGGSFYSYDFLKPYLSDFHIIPLELPGRGKRMSEGLLNDFNLAATDIYNQINSFLDNGSFAIYGHSMGAYLALKVASMLSKREIYPTGIVVSGNIGPHGFEKNTVKRFEMVGDDFINSLKELGGVPDEILKDKETFRFFEPILRSDFEVAEMVVTEDFDVVDVPITAIMGDQEERVDKIDNWARFTTSSCKMHTLPGDHFFIYDNVESLAQIIQSSI